MQRTCQFYIIASILLFLFVSGCSSVLPGKNEPGAHQYEEYARKCYERGISYMEESRYELARQQFSFAAASAVSKPLYLKAADGVRRVNRILGQNR